MPVWYRDQHQNKLTFIWSHYKNLLFNMDKKFWLLKTDSADCKKDVINLFDNIYEKMSLTKSIQYLLSTSWVLKVSVQILLYYLRQADFIYILILYNQCYVIYMECSSKLLKEAFICCKNMHGSNIQNFVLLCNFFYYIELSESYFKTSQFMNLI